MKETEISVARQADPDLDGLIAEIAIDCYDEDEQLIAAFENAFDDAASLPCPGTVVGEDVELFSHQQSRADANCQRAGRRCEIALLHVDINAGPATSPLLAAYRRWLGG
jgi:hypothetical protein